MKGLEKFGQRYGFLEEKRNTDVVVKSNQTKTNGIETNSENPMCDIRVCVSVCPFTKIIREYRLAKIGPKGQSKASVIRNCD